MVQTTIITVKFYFAKLLIFVLLKLFNFNKLKNCVFPQSTTSLPYSKLQVDQLPPIIDRPKKYDYKKLLQDYLQIHNKPLEPIKRRKNPSINTKLSCPFCNAPSDFIYDNNGHRGQFLCKICKSTFHKTTNPDILILLCPHCREKLYKIKDRSGFSIFKCVNKKCPLYLSNLSNLSQTQLQLYKLHPHKFKLHYLFRDFKNYLNLHLTLLTNPL